MLIYCLAYDGATRALSFVPGISGSIREVVHRFHETHISTVTPLQFGRVIAIAS
jgi:hypothetical protein